MLMAGIGRFAYESYYIGVDEVCAELKEKDYQESKEFRNTVLNRFYTFLDVATGNYHGYIKHYSGFSRHKLHMLRYFGSLHIAPLS